MSSSSVKKPRLTWDESFIELQEYYDKHGTSKVPARYPRLGMWVVKQRKANNQNQLTEDQHIKLESVNFVWETKDEKFTRQWNEMFERLQAYRRERVGICMSKRGFFQDDEQLQSWVQNQQSTYKNGTIREDRKSRLEEVGFLWVRAPTLIGIERNMSAHEDAWNVHFEKLALFKEAQGHTMVPADHDDQALHKWVHRQRVCNNNNIMRSDRFQRLEEIGFVWCMTDHCNAETSLKQRHWNYMFKRLEGFCEEHGHANCGKGDDDKELAAWVTFQRSQLADGSMDERRAERFQRFNFDFSTFREDQWNVRYSELVSFHYEHGHCLVPYTHELGTWVHHQRVAKKGSKSCGRLTPHRIKKLEEIGFIWDVFDDQWNVRYSELVSFHNEHGHCLVPCTHKLRRWVQHLRGAKRGHKSCGRLTPHRIKKLEEIGFVWDVLEERWSRLFSRLVAYKKTHGDCNVPDLYEDDKELGHWVKRQRSLVWGSKGGGLEARKKEMLDNIGFVWRLGIENWNEKYAKLVVYNNANDHSNVPIYHKELGQWVSYQRWSSSQRGSVKRKQPPEWEQEAEEDREFIWSDNTHDSSDTVSKQDHQPYSIGTCVKKRFPNDGWFLGKIVSNNGSYKIVYEDDDDEELSIGNPELDSMVEEGRGVTLEEERDLDIDTTTPLFAVGTAVRKHFEGHGWFLGEIVSNNGRYKVVYEDDDEEELSIGNPEVDIIVEEGRRGVTPEEERDLDILGTTPLFAVGTAVRKHFEGHGWFHGRIVSNAGVYRIKYEDNDEEELNLDDTQMNKLVHAVSSVGKCHSFSPSQGGRL